MAVESLSSLRPYLFKIAYSMTGVVEEAEDLVQDAFEKWLSRKNEEVQNPKAYLARMVVNSSLNRLEQLKRERETYKGTWLPEPYIVEENSSALPTLDFGLLFLLERLNPMERAVFIMRESFSETYDEIAELTGVSAENCRQLLHRAKEKLHKRSIHPVDPGTQKQFVEAFLVALQMQDRSALEKLLRRDIELYGDGGGKRSATLKPLFGFEKAAKFLVALGEINKGITFSYRPVMVNGLPAGLLVNDTTGEIDSVLTLDFDANGISALYFVRNPDKIAVRK